jgi:CBS domain-containing protein
MSATLGGTMRTPLTAVVFAFGLTHDANAFLPTLLGCVVAYGFSVVVMPRSILTEKIARRGHHVYREYGVDPLERQFVDEVMTEDVIAIPADLTVATVLADYFGAGQRHRAYPLVAGQQFIGLVDREALQNLPPGLLHDAAGNLLAKVAPDYALPGETCRSVASRMAAHDLERLAVVDSIDSRRLVGIVSRSDLLKPSRQLHDDEIRRERFL